MKRSRAMLDLSSLEAAEDYRDIKRFDSKSNCADKFFDFEYCRIDDTYDVHSSNEHHHHLDENDNFHDDEDNEDYTDNELSTLDNSIHHAGSLSSSIVSLSSSSPSLKFLSSDSLSDCYLNEQRDSTCFVIRKSLLPNNTTISMHSNTKIFETDKKLSNLSNSLRLHKDDEGNNRHDEVEKDVWFVGADAE